MKKKERLDKLLVDKGLVKSRERARSLIMEGKVRVAGLEALKPGTMLEENVSLEVKEADMPYVSRGGAKLASALEFFGVDPDGLVAMDVGCSTGGFTDCLLKKGARKVYAIDVGYGQFDWSLRSDPRVELMEKTNFRFLEKRAIPETVQLIVIDVSFISLVKVLPNAREFLIEGGSILALIKPQFEVGKGMVGKGGVVREEAKRLSVVEDISRASEELGFQVIGTFESPVHGPKGNVEYFILLRRI